MTKTRTTKRTFKLLTSLAIVMLMSLSMILPAFADPGDPPEKWATGTSPTAQAEAVITKALRMPIGTPVPAGKFNFEFEALGMIVNKAVDGSDEAKAGMPAIGPISIEFDGTEDTYMWKEIEDEIYAAKESHNIIKDLAAAAWKNGVGIYKYLLTEEEETLELTDQEGAKYSTAQYEIEIWVDEWFNEQTEANELYVRYIAAWIVKTERDEYYTLDEEGKVVVNPGGEDVEIEDLSQLIFTNRYWKTDGEDIENTALEITKTTTGNDAVLDKPFTFTVTVVKPALITDTAKYKAYVLDEDGDVITDLTDLNVSGGDVTGGLIEVTTNTPLMLDLKHGQRLVFIDLHIGAVVKVMESADPHYKSAYERTFSTKDDGIPDVFVATAANTAWGFPRDLGDKGNHYLPEGKNKNFVNFTNTRTNATPTGLDVDDLPYIVLIGVAVAGLAAFVVIKSRKKAAND